MIALPFDQCRQIGFHYVLDLLRPASVYGRALLRDLRPFAPEERAELQRELDAMAALLPALEPCAAELRCLEQAMRRLRDIRNTLQRGQERTLDDIELFEIKSFLLLLAEMKPPLEELLSAASLHGISLDACPQALDLLDPEGNRVASFQISGRYSRELAEIRRRKRAVEQQLRLDGNWADNRVRDRLLLERSSVVELEQEEEERIRVRLSEQLRPSLPQLLKNTEHIARFDLLLQKTRLAAEHACCRPRIGTASLNMQGMTNPQIAAQLPERGRRFTPLSLELNAGATVLTGANMGGKSVALKTLALNVLLIHCGFYPFAETASTPLFAALHLVSSDLEATERGLSSFGGEVIRFNAIAEELNRGLCLILLDEFGRGTNPKEGAAIARGLVRYLNEQSAYALLTTHFDGVAALAKRHYQVVGLSGLDASVLHANLGHLSLAERLRRIAAAMDYGLLRVDAETELPQEALQICRLLGLKDEVLAAIEETTNFS